MTMNLRLVSSKLAVWIVALIASTRPAPSCSFTNPSKWSINEPNVTYDEWTDIFTMNYGLDPSLNFTENLRSDILLRNCTYPKLGVADGIVSDYINSTGYHIFEVDPYKMSQDPRLFEYGLWDNSTTENPQTKAEIDLCVRASLWTGPESNPNAAEAASFETIVTLHIDLVDNPSLEDFNSASKLKPGESEIIEFDEFEVYAYFCDPTTQEWADILPVSQGELITICVESMPEALYKGVYIESIKEFAWVRVYDDGSNFTQGVISNGTLVDPWISFYDCVPPLIICDFSMLMLADFFMDQGEATGIGIARLGFGPSIPLPENYTGYVPPGPTARFRLLRDGPPPGHKQQQQQQKRSTQTISQTIHLPSQQEQRRRQQQQQEEAPERESAGGSGFGLVVDLMPGEDRVGQLKTAGGEGRFTRNWVSAFAGHLIVLGSVFWLGLDWYLY